MEFIDSAIEEYARVFSGEPSALLQELDRETHAMILQPRMLSGHLQGRFLSFFAKVCRPTTILEIGTFTGFSALCLAKGLKHDGELHTIEIREEDALTATRFFNRSFYAAQIKLHLGNALDIIPSIDMLWDLVFIDADKVNYIEYYELTLQRLRPGGWIIADNVLFHGQVLESPVKGKNALAIHQFNEYVKNDDRVQQTLITVRDGLLFIKKKDQ
jgi:predicted O-methyltransferase YrrM